MVSVLFSVVPSGLVIVISSLSPTFASAGTVILTGVVFGSPFASFSLLFKNPSLFASFVNSTVGVVGAIVSVVIVSLPSPPLFPALSVI